MQKEFSELVDQLGHHLTDLEKSEIADLTLTFAYSHWSPTGENGAPALWLDRTDDDKGLTPPDFVRKYYSVWFGFLTRSDLKTKDPGLYRALNTWLGSNPKPVDLLPEVPALKVKGERKIAGAIDPAKIEEIGRVILNHGKLLVHRAKNAPKDDWFVDVSDQFSSKEV